MRTDIAVVGAQGRDRWGELGGERHTPSPPAPPVPPRRERHPTFA